MGQESRKYSKVEIDGRLMIVTINRPEVYNALHPMANQELSDVFDEFAANPELWVAIITGAGDKAFSRRQRSQVSRGAAGPRPADGRRARPRASAD